MNPDGASRPASIRIQRRIEWSDTDASGHWHNSAAFRMVEWAEAALFDRLGILDAVYGYLPRVHIEADFKELLDHRDLVDATLEVVAVGHSSLTYGFAIERDGELCVEMTVVAALLDSAGAKRRWPDDLRRLLLSSGPQAPELLVSG